MNRIFLYITYLFTASLLLFSCTKEHEQTITNPLPGLTKLAAGYAAGAAAKVEIWGTKNFFVGYNSLTLVVYDSIHPLQKITDAHIYLSPVLTLTHGATSEQQTSPADAPDEVAVNGVFPCAVTFTAASGTNASWTLGVALHNHKYDKEGEVTFHITID